MSAVPQDAADKRPTFTSRSVAWMLGVGTLAFLALVALATFQPELQGGQDGGAHALSRSAVGFAGLVQLMKDTGAPVVIARGPLRSSEGRAGLVIQTPPAGADMAKARPDLAGRIRLIVLDKWIAPPDPLHPGWVTRGGLQPADRVERLTTQARAQVRLARRGASGSLSLAGLVPPDSPTVLDPIDRLQTVEGLANAEPLIRDETGRPVFWRIGTNIYVLTDPDFLNNQGLQSVRNARFSVALIDWLRSGGPVVFDVTVNGFSRARSILRVALGPPFLGATLCALAAALLMGFHAAARFGPAMRSERALALGKRTLVDNSALLIRLARREHRMGGRYAALIRRAAIKGLALGREADPNAADAALDRLAGAGEQPFSTLVAEAEQAGTQDQLMRAARALHRRKLEMTRERI
jgi:hypothetical protein